MSLTQRVTFDDFSLKKLRVVENTVEVDYTEKKVIAGEVHLLDKTLKAKYLPHPDLLKYKDSLKEYLVGALSLNKGFDIALKYTKGEQKNKVENKIIELYQSIEIIGVSIAGADQLRGVVISGKIKSYNGSKCALSTPRIVFSSDKIGIEVDVDGQVELLEREVYKYIFEGKKAQAELFEESEVLEEEKEPSSLE